ncbi:hypothetical protein [Estrella lausannensis]|uniref:Conserved putative membrane protein n=1 Tax=Estrella lausannensis TaxID=483423 RepID=A0A0H5DSH9_9BACT|nr:hypothetical protein [Estrella lausannensis]CRX38734.1 Conserved putative membrane protein [Estrella lausannensis]
MIATLFSTLIAALILFTPFFTPAEKPFASWYLLVATSFFLLFSFILTQIFAWAPIQKVQQNLTPRLLEIYKKDNVIRLGGAFLALLAIFSLYLAVDGTIAKKVGDRPFTAIYFVLLGISIDIVHHIISRMTSYINPFAIASQCTAHAKNATLNGNDLELCNWIEAVSEVGINSASRSLPSLCNQAVIDLQIISRDYLKASKSFAHHVDKKAEGEKGDPVSFTLFFIFQRFEIIFNKALEHKLEPVITTIITSLGKMIVDSAKYDISMATYPIHYLGFLAAKAQRGGLAEVGDKAIVTYLEVAKVIVRDIDLKYLELQEPFFTMTGRMEELSKEIFRNNREINIAILIQPFKQLKGLFEDEKLSQHQDSPVIVADINRVINEFEQLQLVMKTIPPLTDITQESK